MRQIDGKVVILCDMFGVSFVILYRFHDAHDELPAGERVGLNVTNIMSYHLNRDRGFATIKRDGMIIWKAKDGTMNPNAKDIVVAKMYLYGGKPIREKQTVTCFILSIKATFTVLKVLGKK